MAQTFCFINAKGRLGGQPDIIWNENKKVISNFSIACSSYRKKEGAWVEQTNWIKCTAYGKIAAEELSTATGKDLVTVNGLLSKHIYTKEGQEVVNFAVKSAKVSVDKSPESGKTSCTAYGCFRVGRNPEYKVLADRDPVLELVNFNTVYNTYKKEPGSGGEWDQESDWFKCVNFGVQASTIADTLKGGDLVFIQGDLNREIYNRDGVDKTNFTINVDHAKVLLSKSWTNKQDSDQIARDADDTEDYPF